MINQTIEQFFTACIAGDCSAVSPLLRNLIDVNIKTKEGWTGLVLAVFNEHHKVAKLLVAHGADVNATNHKGTTVLMYAKTPVLQSKNTEMLAWLLDQGANINATTKEHMTVLDYVNKLDAEWLAEWLIKKGAKKAPLIQT